MGSGIAQDCCLLSVLKGVGDRNEDCSSKLEVQILSKVPVLSSVTSKEPQLSLYHKVIEMVTYHFTCRILFNPQTSLPGRYYRPILDRGKNCGSGELSNLSKATQLASGRYEM